MNDEELARVPTVDRFEADLDDWQPALENTRALNDLAENGDPDAFTGARKKITGVLRQMEDARRFIAVKKDFLQTFAPAGVATLFLDDRSVRRIDAPEADLRLRDAGTAE